jgi:hypothetical protein
MSITVKYQNIVYGVENNFSALVKAKLGKFVSSAAEILVKIHNKLEASYERSIYQQDLPVLLFAKGTSLSAMELKHNIDCYLQYGFRSTKDEEQRAQLIAIELISDYCVGLEVLPDQKARIYQGTRFDLVAPQIKTYLKAYDCAGHHLQNLIVLCDAMSGELNLDGPL